MCSLHLLQTFNKRGHYNREVSERLHGRLNKVIL